jgi:hypothetical protein
VVYMKHPDLGDRVVEVQDSAERMMVTSGWQRLNKTESAKYEKGLRADLDEQEAAMQASTPGVDTDTEENK